jgi:hypothetical protein
MNINLFTFARPDSGEPHSPSLGAAARTVLCPSCSGDVAPLKTQTGWQSCPYCHKQLQIQLWPANRRYTSAAAALPDQATCFFHPDKAFQACCKRCGRFVCALCDLQLGSEHVCPTCFERGRADSGREGGNAEWRHRDVLYDSISVTLGWAWILIWPVFVAALPAAIILHVKYRKAPRSYLIPRSGWRFWAAYPGLAWLPVLLTASFLIARIRGVH